MNKKLLKTKILFYLIAIIVLVYVNYFLCLPLFVKAESLLYLSPADGSYTVGNNFSVYLFINSGADSINSITASLSFDKNKLSVVSIDVSESILTTWVEYPSFSNATGIIKFTGGIPTLGFNGIGKILKINFIGLIANNANVIIQNGSQILLNDGLGSNVLFSTANGSYNILPVFHPDPVDPPQVIEKDLIEDKVIEKSIIIDNTNTQNTQNTQKEENLANVPVSLAINKIFSATGLIIYIISLFLFSQFSLSEMFLLPFKLMGILLIAFGLRKKYLPWGTVYDSVTKQPIDPAYVILKDANGNKVSSIITDFDGRYGFLVNPSVYSILVKRSNYSFPSKKLFGKIKDEFYENLYFGQNININKEYEVINKNIPLDPINFDWNQFIKKDKKLINIYSKADLTLRKFSNYFFFAGFIVSIASVFVSPFMYNFIILAIYLFLLLFRFFGIKPLSVGYIVDKINGNPLPFSIIRVVVPKLNLEIAHKVADKYGRYYCLVSKGQYFIKIEKKNKDGTYSLVYTSDIINVSKDGIIRQKFKV